MAKTPNYETRYYCPNGHQLPRLLVISGRYVCGHCHLRELQADCECDQHDDVCEGCDPC